MKVYCLATYLQSADQRDLIYLTCYTSNIYNLKSSINLLKNNSKLYKLVTCDCKKLF
jgi:hypothetical protein